MTTVKHNNGRQEFFVCAATVAGKLTSIMQIAREISLAAKNAKAIAERAGEKAQGFKPITDYIDDMGRETILLVGKINDVALYVSRHAVSELRAIEACHHFEMAARKMEGGVRDLSLQRVMVDSRAEVDELHARVRKQAWDLKSLLDEIGVRMRASSVISTRSRVEATRAQDHQQSLEVVAETVESASEKIKQIVQECEHILYDNAA